MIFGCVCDSKWQVGLGAGQTQEPEWFGPDCSLRHCPSGDDPSTDVDETDCFNVTSSSVYPGTAVSLDPHIIYLDRPASVTGGGEDDGLVSAADDMVVTSRKWGAGRLGTRGARRLLGVVGSPNDCPYMNTTTSVLHTCANDFD